MSVNSVCLSVCLSVPRGCPCRPADRPARAPRTSPPAGRSPADGWMDYQFRDSLWSYIYYRYACCRLRNILYINTSQKELLMAKYSLGSIQNHRNMFCPSPSSPSQIVNKIRLDQIYHLKLRRPGVVRGGREDQGGSSGMGEETKGGRLGWVRRPRGVVRGG